MSLKNLLLFATMATIAIATTQLESSAVRYPNGKLAFESTILLVDTHATFNEVRARQAKYYFDLKLSEDVGESLGKVEIEQRAGGEEVKFKLDKTQVYLGTHHRKQQEIEAFAFDDPTTGKITVELKKGVGPGSSLTIALKPKRNPDLAGVYLFGVTAFPPGERSLGLYLGAGRLHFYQSDPFHF